MWSTASQRGLRVYGTIYLTVLPSTIVALVRTHEGPHRRQFLVLFPKLSRSQIKCSAALWLEKKKEFCHRPRILCFHPKMCSVHVTIAKNHGEAENEKAYDILCCKWNIYLKIDSCSENPYFSIALYPVPMRPLPLAALLPVSLAATTAAAVLLHKCWWWWCYVHRAAHIIAKRNNDAYNW